MNLQILCLPVVTVSKFYGFTDVIQCFIKLFTIREGNGVSKPWFYLGKVHFGKQEVRRKGLPNSQGCQTLCLDVGLQFCSNSAPAPGCHSLSTSGKRDLTQDLLQLR